MSHRLITAASSIFAFYYEYRYMNDALIEKLLHETNQYEQHEIIIAWKWFNKIKNRAFKQQFGMSEKQYMETMPYPCFSLLDEYRELDLLPAIWYMLDKMLRFEKRRDRKRIRRQLNKLRYEAVYNLNSSIERCKSSRKGDVSFIA